MQTFKFMRLSSGFLPPPCCGLFARRIGIHDARYGSFAIDDITHHCHSDYAAKRAANLSAFFLACDTKLSQSVRHAYGAFRSQSARYLALQARMETDARIDRNQDELLCEALASDMRAAHVALQMRAECYRIRCEKRYHRLLKQIISHFYGIHQIVPLQNIPLEAELALSQAHNRVWSAEAQMDEIARFVEHNLT